ncbi:MAG: transporter suffix domain-containing protein [Proteobacteria bacterium]|nr:transporter suffix domain-containing protein [Pseudomonadota bacterium]
MKKDWKYYLGLSLFIYSFLPIAVVAILPFMGLTLAQSGAFAVVFLASGEITFMTAAALLGREFLAALKKRILTIFKRTHVPRPVSRARHRVGVALLVVSTLPYYAMLIYLLFFSHKETAITFLVWAMVAGEAAFIAGLFLLGGQFWDRLKHLFDWPGNQWSEEKYRTILESIQEGYYELDLTGNYTFFNDALCKIRGYPRDELMGMNFGRNMDKNKAKAVYAAANRVVHHGGACQRAGYGERKEGRIQDLCRDIHIPHKRFRR